MQPNRIPKEPARKFTFTDATLRQLTPPASGQRVVWDEKQTGLSVLASSGGTKTFRATFCLNGKYYTDKIGRVGELPLGEARKRTAIYRQLAGDGTDPRKPKPSPLTYGELVDRFIELYAKPRHRTWVQTEKTLRNNFVDWVKRPVAEITRGDARTILRGFIADGHPYKASVSKAWITKLWRWAAEEELVVLPIMDSLGIHIEKESRDRVYSDAEVKAIWDAAGQMDPVKSAYFKLLLLLAPRKSALAGMRWSDIKDNVWITPFELTKSKKTSIKKRTYQTPLSPLVQRVLSGLPRTDARVFPIVPPRPPRKFSAALRKHGAPADFSYHVVRHTVATWSQNNGASEWEVGLILNHSGSGVTAGYSHGHSLPLKLKLLTQWADHVASIVQPEGVTVLR
jgi:integrase